MLSEDDKIDLFNKLDEIEAELPISLTDCKDLSCEDLESMVTSFFEELKKSDILEIEINGLILDNRFRILLESLGFKIEHETISSFCLNIPQLVDEKIQTL